MAETSDARKRRIEREQQGYDSLMSRLSDLPEIESQTGARAMRAAARDLRTESSDVIGQHLADLLEWRANLESAWDTANPSAPETRLCNAIAASLIERRLVSG